jgi:hypothetical protein
MDDRGPGDSRSIENPPHSAREPEEKPVKGKTADDAGREGECVSEAGEGLVTEEGVNERETRAP